MLYINNHAPTENTSRVIVPIRFNAALVDPRRFLALIPRHAHRQTDSLFLMRRHFFSRARRYIVYKVRMIKMIYRNFVPTRFL